MSCAIGFLHLDAADHRVSFYAGYELSIVEKSRPATLISELLVMLFCIGGICSFQNQEFTLVRANGKAEANFLQNVSREFHTSVHFILANSKQPSPRIPVNLIRPLISI
ncbi:MAG: hypothetical protein ACJATW_000856 [Glaciecola sp.]|jgi:hypothetical protein